MNVSLFTQQIEKINWRLSELYQDANTSIQSPTELLPVAFKELGIASEELQVAVEELQLQNNELIASQAAVEEQRQRYYEMFEFAPEAYLVTDLVGTIQEANRSAVEMLNVSQKFILGKPLSIFISENERQTFRCQLTLQQQTEQVQEWAFSISPRNRKPCDVVMRVVTVRDNEGRAVKLRICMRLSDSQLAEAAPERSDYDTSQDRPKHTFLKGEIIPLNPQTIWQVYQGMVKLSTVCENGEEVIVGLAGPSMPFGSVLTSLDIYQATAFCAVQLVQYSLTEIAASPHLSQTVLNRVDQRLRQTEALLAISRQRRVKSRFSQLLQLLKQEIGQPVAQGTRLSLRFTHQDLAEACSTTRVTITRLLGNLQEEGLIIIDFQNHIVLKS